MSTRNDDVTTEISEEERAAMSQLAGSNPRAGQPPANGKEALYQRITQGEQRTSDAPAWRRWPVAVAGLAVVVVVAVASFVMLGGGNGDDPDGLAANPDGPGGDPTGGFATCIGYSEDELRLREFAFSGTATEVTDTHVTFAVDEWFAGDRGASVTLELDHSLLSEMYSDVTFAEGEKYLVSGDADFAWGCGFTRPFDGELAAEWEAAIVGGPSAVNGSQAIGGGASAGSCAFMYAPDTLAQRDRAFIGTVTGIEDGTGPGGISYPNISFEVEEWFAGEGAATIQLLGSGLAYGYEPGDEPQIEPGGRYLVSGDGEFAWGCGFTRTYSDEEAQLWRAAFDQ